LLLQPRVVERLSRFHIRVRIGATIVAVAIIVEFRRRLVFLGVVWLKNSEPVLNLHRLGCNLGRPRVLEDAVLVEDGVLAAQEVAAGASRRQLASLWLHQHVCLGPKSSHMIEVDLLT